MTLTLPDGSTLEGTPAELRKALGLEPVAYPLPQLVPCVPVWPGGWIPNLNRNPFDDLTVTCQVRS